MQRPPFTRNRRANQCPGSRIRSQPERGNEANGNGPGSARGQIRVGRERCFRVRLSHTFILAPPLPRFALADSLRICLARNDAADGPFVACSLSPRGSGRGLALACRLSRASLPRLRQRAMGAADTRTDYEIRRYFHGY